jgi:energy-coupling factor transporter ATP-binding protein EcfA2
MYYRSVEDSEKFTIEPDVTCLVGKNESGKTNVLQALYRINPVESSAGFEEVIDFPSRLTRQRRKVPAGELIPVATAVFKYSSNELARIESDLGAGTLTTPEVTVSVGYRGGRTVDHDYDEAAIVRHLCSALAVEETTTRALATQTTVAGLLQALEALTDPSAEVQALAARIRGWREQDPGLYLIDTYAMPMMPKFVYFDDYDFMPGKVSIPDLISRRDAGTLRRGEQALLSMLTLAGVKPEDFQQADQHERLIRELENTANVISDEVFEYWTQNKELAVDLEILQPETGAVPPLNSGPILEVRVHNQRHRVTVAFSERSRGFIWFFSFLVYFNELEDAHTRDLILLLDEPGLSLHARAQGDLLRLIDERLAPRHQVLYTSHSPFMVSADQFQRVRTVIDHDSGGTKVSAEVFQADEDTAFPLLTTMGIELTQTLFVGEHTLLLEGPSDLIYLDVLSDLAQEQGAAGLDPRWVKTPVGGAGKLSTFVTLLGANKLHVAVVVDSSTKDTGAIRRLRDNGQLAANGLIEISEFTSANDADIEDLFDRDFYLSLVNRAYSAELPRTLTPADLNQHDPRVVRTIEDYFRQNNIAGGKFDHYRPAAVLLRYQATLLPQITQPTITRFGQLFARANGLLT